MLISIKSHPVELSDWYADSFQLYTHEWLLALFCETCSSVKSGALPKGDLQLAEEICLVQEVKGFGGKKMLLSASQI